MSDLIKIAKILIKNINKRLKEKNLSLKMTESALTFIVAKGSNIEYGARPLKRYIQQEIEDQIAEKILLGQLDKEGEIVIDVEKYRNEQPKQQLSLAEQNKREQLENEYNDALEIVLNNDPQGKWSGCTLAEILAKDIEWFKWAKADMRNPYIKKFVCVICEHDNIK